MEHVKTVFLWVKHNRVLHFTHYTLFCPVLQTPHFPLVLIAGMWCNPSKGNWTSGVLLSFLAATCVAEHAGLGKYLRLDKYLFPVFIRDSDTHWRNVFGAIGLTKPQILEVFSLHEPCIPPLFWLSCNYMVMLRPMS